MAGISPAYARDFFVSRGYSAGGAAGIVGNLMQESGGRGTLNTLSRNAGDGRDGSDSIGIAQWNGSRARELKAFAVGQGKTWTDGDVQLAFIDKELKRDHGSIAAYLKGNVTPAQGAKSFIGFERPKGWNTGGGEIGNRIKYANQVGGAAPGSGAITVTGSDGSDITEMFEGGGGSVSSGSGSGSGGSSTVPEAIDKQAASDAATAAEIAANSSTNLYNSLQDYAGRFIIVALGLIFVAGGVFLFSKGSGTKIVKKALAG